MNRASVSILARAVARLALLLALVALAVAACGSATPAATDPYQIASKATDANYDQVKVQVGLQVTGGGQDIAIDPGAIEIVLDSKAGKGSFHLALPLKALGSSASSLQALGVTGDTLDVDVLFDGQALYAKTPLAAKLLPLLMAQAGQTVSGDLTGWLKLGTAEELAGLAGAAAGLGTVPEPSGSAEPLSALDPAQLKKDLEDSGVVVAYAGSEKRNGVDSDHLTLTVDPKKLVSGPMAKQLPANQLGQLQGLAGAGTLTADMWLDKATGRLTELDLHVAATDGTKADVTVLLSTPSGVSFEAPATYTDVPVAPLLQTLMQTFGGSLLPQN